MTLTPVWTNPVELNSDDNLTGEVINEQILQNILFLREATLVTWNSSVALRVEGSLSYVDVTVPVATGALMMYIRLNHSTDWALNLYVDDTLSFNVREFGSGRRNLITAFGINLGSRVISLVGNAISAGRVQEFIIWSI